jgi:uncharacterized protein YjbI with pentapeptide repeats
LNVTNFSGANLIDADFSLANLKGANLRGTNLRGAKLLNVQTIVDAEFTGAKNMSESVKAYLCSIASGTHPFTKHKTKESLGCP